MPAATWGFVSRRLADSFRVLSVDLPGRGLSDPGPPDRHSIHDYARDLLSIVQSLGLVSPMLVGHSLGARVAAAFAVNYPGVAAPVVVADPPLCGPGEPPYATPLNHFLVDIETARTGDAESHIRSQHPTWSDEQIGLRARWLATCNKSAIAADYAHFSAEDFFGLWSRLPKPSMLLYGTESPMYTAAAVERLARANPTVTIVPLEGAGHMLPFDDLEGFLSAILRAASLNGITCTNDPHQVRTR